MVKIVEIIEIVPYLPFQFIKRNFTALQKTNKQTGEIQKKKKRKGRKRRSFTSQRGFTQSDIKCDRITLPYYPIFLMVPFEEHFSYPLFTGKKSRRFSYFVEVITRNH